MAQESAEELGVKLGMSELQSQCFSPQRRESRFTTRSPTPLNPNWEMGKPIEELSGIEWENTCEAPKSLPSRLHMSGVYSLSPLGPNQQLRGCPPKLFLPPS